VPEDRLLKRSNWMIPSRSSVPSNHWISRPSGHSTPIRITTRLACSSTIQVRAKEMNQAARPVRLERSSAQRWRWPRSSLLRQLHRRRRKGVHAIKECGLHVTRYRVVLFSFYGKPGEGNIQSMCDRERQRHGREDHAGEPASRLSAIPIRLVAEATSGSGG
jgi:hypothetical protein